MIYHVGSHQANYSSLESSGDKESILNLKPHPPSVPSTDRARRRPRIVSGGKEKDQNNTGSRGIFYFPYTVSKTNTGHMINYFFMITGRMNIFSYYAYVLKYVSKNWSHFTSVIF